MTTSLPSSFAPQPTEHERPTVSGVALPHSMWLLPTSVLLAPAQPDALEHTAPEPEASIAVFAPPPIEQQPHSPHTGTPPQPLIAERVVHLLGSGRSPDEICRLLCEQHGYAWEHAQRLVHGVAAQQRVHIARRQAPFLLFLGITTLLAGLALLALGIMRLRGMGGALYAPSSYRTMFAALISGALMVLGAGVGLAEVIGSLRK